MHDTAPLAPPSTGSLRFTTLLVANRGEIARRIIRTVRRLGIRAVAVYSEADAGTPHTLEADEAVSIGAAAPTESYLDGDKIIAVAKQCGADAIHPGYGFLSENADFARKCAANGITFVGPTPENMIEFGLKHQARELAAKLGVPLLPGSSLLNSISEAIEAADAIGYPVMLKATGGGGGIGIGRCDDADSLRQHFERVRSLGHNFFANSSVFLEKFIAHGRHIEVQIFGDAAGTVIALGERDCSIQRRNQKVIEETPSPFVTGELRAKLFDYAVRLGKAASYRSAGTVEFIVDCDTSEPYLLEVNTRLQVEHGVTEYVYGVDLVEWMIRTAAGENLNLQAFAGKPRGHAIQARLYAEVAYKDFQPCAGLITEISWATLPESRSTAPQSQPDVRIDTWVDKGTELTAAYDPLIAKMIVWGETRGEAVTKIGRVLSGSRVGGIETNRAYLTDICKSDAFASGAYSTRFLQHFKHTPCTVEVVDPGIYSTIQDYPGRVNYWSIGVPPSGPMDNFAFRLANSLVGNAETAAGLEMTIRGATLKFHTHTSIAITGAPMRCELNGKAIALWKEVYVPQGSVLTIGAIQGGGARSYLAVKYGFDVPEYLGSRSTFVLGKFGGHQGRPIAKGDFLPLDARTASTPPLVHEKAEVDAAMGPEYPAEWQLGVLVGPHAAPDFLTEQSLTEFLSTPWQVHYNSNRLGIRLVGPKPQWARKDGGDAGLHPSNIHDCEYAVGSINFSGDTPIILTCDGPSLGGFICPATIAKAELWKVGQIKSGDTVRFVAVTEEWACEQERLQDDFVRSIASKRHDLKRLVGSVVCTEASAPSTRHAIVRERNATASTPAVQYRRAGDKYLLVEYGAPVLDLALRLRVYALMQALHRDPIAGILELSPGVRSLQIKYESKVIGQSLLIDALTALEASLPAVHEMKIPTRVVRMPLSFEDDSTLDAIGRYRQSVRSTAPYLPSNIEFIRRINGLSSTDEVRKIIFDASYLVLGLGDVYLGAPCAVPLDPRHRLVTSKYNPARTYTPEGAVGIGGVYMCIYGMDSPGGYQLVGRTVPIWNKFSKNSDFTTDEPWLLRFFDQVQFYEVSEAELRAQRADYALGRLHLDVKEDVFDYRAYTEGLKVAEAEIQAFQRRQKSAFNEELSRWHSEFQSSNEAPASPGAESLDGGMGDGLGEDWAAELGVHVKADISGNIWHIAVSVGEAVEVGTSLGTLEAMKMEFSLVSESSGIVKEIRCQKGVPVKQGESLFVIHQP